MITNIRGLGVALVTPFTPKSEIDFEALNRLVGHVSDGGVDYLVVLGTTAETPTLSTAERAKIVGFVKENNRRNLPIVVGIGGNDTAAIVQSIKSFDLDGVEALLSVTPYYNRPSQRGLYEHYKAIAQVSPVPVILYNVPPRTGTNMLAETTLKLAHDFPVFCAIKEACGNIAQMKEILDGRPDGFMVISGDDGLAVPLIKEGGEGVISVVANAFPLLTSTIIKAAFDGDDKRIGELLPPFEKVIKQAFAEGNPTGIKTALSLRGIIENRLRLPLVEGSDALVASMKTAMYEIGQTGLF
jgi:4-hydroxy-tetrahydrodipicolinate synthase